MNKVMICINEYIKQLSTMTHRRLYNQDYYFFQQETDKSDFYMPFLLCHQIVE